MPTLNLRANMLTTTAAPDRVEDIAIKISAAIGGVVRASDDKSEAQEAFQSAVAASNNLRVETIKVLTDMALAETWTDDEYKRACSRAAQKDNRKDKSAKTFVSELNHAMHSRVRPLVRNLIALAHDAWEAERDDKDTPKDKRPCAKAWVREYHMMIAMFKAVETGEVSFHGISDVVSWSKDHDPDLDYKKVSAKLTAIREQLANFGRDFPVEGFTDIDAFLGEITEDILKAARQAKLDGDERRLQSHTLAPVVTPTVVADNTAPDATEPAEGVYDVCEDALAA